MKMTVDLKMSYVCGCEECAKDIENTIAAAIRDRTVTGVKLTVSPRCDHESAEQLSARMTAPVSQIALSGVVNCAPDAGLGGSAVSPPPPSDAHTGVASGEEGGVGPMFAELGNPMNGFDTGGVI